VPSQVCDAAIEEQLAKDLETIGDSLKTRMTFEKTAKPAAPNAALQKEESVPSVSSVPPSEH
jgi:hypothetical protein